MIRYRGRFAPSPTGPLHFGSLVAAAASFLDARAHDGEWLVRMEDVDWPRSEAGAADRIVEALRAFGFAWDGEVVSQSRRHDAYRAAFDLLRVRGLVYPCGCSRKDAGGELYPGTCRNGLAPGRTPRAWRLRVPDDAVVEFEDRLRGRFRERLAETCGDFVLYRADGIWAYQLAVVVDDAWQGVTHVVRGEDLLSSTARQIQLQRALGLPAVSYLHVPLALDAAGQKLSKQTKAPAIDARNASALLLEALRLLGQSVDAGMEACAPGEILRRAARCWAPARMKVK